MKINRFPRFAQIARRLQSAFIAMVSFNPYDVFKRVLSIIGSFAVNRTFHESIMLLQSGKINLAPIVSHQLLLEAFAEGLRLAQEDPLRMKVQFSL